MSPGSVAVSVRSGTVPFGRGAKPCTVFAVGRTLHFPRHLLVIFRWPFVRNISSASEPRELFERSICSASMRHNSLFRRSDDEQSFKGDSSRRRPIRRFNHRRVHAERSHIVRWSLLADMASSLRCCGGRLLSGARSVNGTAMPGRSVRCVAVPFRHQLFRSSSQGIRFALHSGNSRVGTFA